MKKIKISINKKNVDKLKENIVMNTDRINRIKAEKENKKAKNKKRAIIYIVAIVVIIAIIVLSKYRHILGISLNKEGYIKDSVYIEVQNNKNNYFGKYNDELLVFSNSNLETYNSSGNKTWGYKIDEILTPIISTNASNMVIANENGSIFYIFNNKQQVAVKKIDGNIKEIYINRDGYTAIEYSTTGYQAVIGVFDPRGKEIFNVYLTTSIISTFKISDDNRYLIFSEIDTTGITPITNIKLVELNNNKEIKQIVSKDNSMLIDLVINGNKIIMKTDSEISIYDISTSSNTKIKDLTEEQILFVDIKSDAYAYIKKNDNIEQDNSIIVMNYSGKKISELVYDNTPKMFGYLDGIVWTISDKEILFSTMFGGVVKTYSNQFGISDFVTFNGQKSAAVILTNKIYIINI